MRAPWLVPRAVCSAISTRLVRFTLASIAGQSMPVGSRLRRSITSASTPASSAAAMLAETMAA